MTRDAPFHVSISRLTRRQIEDAGTELTGQLHREATLAAAGRTGQKNQARGLTCHRDSLHEVCGERGDERWGSVFWLPRP